MNVIVGVLSFRLWMSECSIDDYKFSKQNQLLMYTDSVNETYRVDQVDSFKKYHPLVWLWGLRDGVKLS